MTNRSLRSGRFSLINTKLWKSQDVCVITLFGVLAVSIRAFVKYFSRQCYNEGQSENRQIFILHFVATLSVIVAESCS